VSCLRENLTSSSYGKGLETDRASTEVPRQSLTRQLFFKCIKQNLKIKSFVGTSKNAVMTQVWIAMCVYLLLAWIKFASRIDLSIQQILRLFQLNLFDRRDLLQLLKGDPPEPPDQPMQARLGFA